MQLQDSLTVEGININEVRRAMAIAPHAAGKFAKTALVRFARRVAKRVKKESLSGRPGIQGGPWARAKDRNIQGLTKGTELRDLQGIVRVSRILRTHVEGATIKASSGLLTLHTKTGIKGKGTVLAQVPSVRIPKRVRVVEPWEQELPRVAKDVHAALARAMKAALDKQMKPLLRALGQ